jgi:hypothetical protein
MHRLVYLCDWLPPDFGAVGQYSLLFAGERAAAGQDVVLAGLTSGQPGTTDEQVGAGRLRVVRRRAPLYDRSRLGARAWWTARTNLGLLWAVRGAVRRADEILITGSPPFLLHLAAPLAALLRKTLVYRITDFHPECLMAERGLLDDAGQVRSRRGGVGGVGSGDRDGSGGGRGDDEADGSRGDRGRWRPGDALLIAFHRLTVALRRRLVDRFEVLGQDQRQRLLAQGIAGDRIVLKRDPSPVEIPPGTAPLERPAELAGRCVLLYSGNFGVAHDHQTFVAGYRLHHRQGSGRVGLWLNATGARADLVEKVLRDEGLPLVRGRPLPLALLARLLVTPDAHLITLRNPFVGYVLPSKVYGCLASRRDILYAGSRRSDIHLLADAAGGGYFQVETGDAQALAAALEALADRAAAATVAAAPAAATTATTPAASEARPAAGAPPR